MTPEQRRKIAQFIVWGRGTEERLITRAEIQSRIFKYLTYLEGCYEADSLEGRDVSSGKEYGSQDIAGQIERG